MLVQFRALAHALPFVFSPRRARLEYLWYKDDLRYLKIRRELKPHFDDEFYVKSYPHVAETNFGPLRHYIVRGWREGYDPCDWFSTHGYRELNSDLEFSHTNPFLHYVKHGRREGRSSGLSAAGVSGTEPPTEPLFVPPLPTDDEWRAMTPRVIEPKSAPGVNVVVPVYKSLPHVAATLSSLLTSRNETPFEVLVIDDASPDQNVSALLRKLAAIGLIRLLVNNRNRGFVASVNRAMGHNRDRDVVLLNSDTLVSDGWLDGVMAPFDDDPTIATVTPLSNNATIASYPNFARDNDFELELPNANLNAIAQAVNGRTVVDVPTGVGFCMAIRRSALANVGAFDVRTFGMGYGEECDFCMRAFKKGWRNVLATGAYVRHFGSTSFGPEMAERSQQAQRRLAAKHPDYDGRVKRHLAADPALPSRILLDVARLQQAVGPISVLFFTHTRGGGIATYLDYLRMSLERDGLQDVADRAILIRTKNGGFTEVESFSGVRLPYLPNLARLNVERHRHLMPKIMQLLDPELIHMNSFAGLTVPSIARLMEALVESRRPYWHVWHDHQPLCPRITFLDAEEKYCGELDASRCVPCLAASSAMFEWARIEDWRSRFENYFKHAELVSAPSVAAAERARRLAGAGKVKLHPHPEPVLRGVDPVRRKLRPERHLLILGAIGSHKGANLLWAMVRDARRRALPLHFDIVGHTSARELKTGPHLTVHGRYDGDADAAARIQKLQPDFCLVSSIYPETYVFTLSVVMALGLPAIAFDMGAQGERVAGYGRGRVIDAHFREDPVALNDLLVNMDVDTLWDAPANASFNTRSALSERFLKMSDAAE